MADSYGRSGLGHNSNLAQSRTERPVAQPGSILLGATQAIFSFSVTHANLLFETFACTAGGGKSGSACGMPTVVGVPAGTPTVTITFPTANAPVASVSVCVCVLQMRKLHSKRKTQRLTYKIAVQDSVRGREEGEK